MSGNLVRCMPTFDPAQGLTIANVWFCMLDVIIGQHTRNDETLILIMLDRQEHFQFFITCKRTNGANNAIHYAKLGKKRRESSKRNHNVICPRVIIKVIIIVPCTMYRGIYDNLSKIVPELSHVMYKMGNIPWNDSISIFQIWKMSK